MTAFYLADSRGGFLSLIVVVFVFLYTRLKYKKGIIISLILVVGLFLVAASSRLSEIDGKDNIVDFIDRYFPLEGLNILEFGCGTGALSCALATDGAYCVAVDPSDINLKSASARAKYFGVNVDFRKVGIEPGSAPRWSFRYSDYKFCI